jgi:hypothetical protein
MRYAALILIGLPLWSQSVAHRYPAGTGADGARLTVVQKHYPKRAPSDTRCFPAEQYVLEQSRDGQAASSEPVVTLCQTEDEAEITVDVAPNAISVNRNGGAHAGYYLNTTYQLSPWRTAGVEECSFFGSGEYTVEEWDLRKMRGQAWHANPQEIDGICVKDAKLFTYLMVPSAQVDARRMEASRARLGNCAFSMDASGRNGFVIFGKADPQDPLEVKLLEAGPRTLLAQVVDPKRNTKPAASWVNADHFEVWMGTRGELGGPDTTWQFGIPVDEGPVQVGYGKPKQLPVVRRWAATLPDGRAAIVLNIELPPQPNSYSDGFTVVYSQGLEGRAQKRMIGTSRMKRGDPNTMGSYNTALSHDSAREYLTCDIVQGSLDISGGGPKPVLVPPPQAGSSR